MWGHFFHFYVSFCKSGNQAQPFCFSIVIKRICWKHLHYLPKPLLVSLSTLQATNIWRTTFSCTNLGSIPIFKWRPPLVAPPLEFREVTVKRDGLIVMAEFTNQTSLPGSVSTGFDLSSFSTQPYQFSLLQLLPHMTSIQRSSMISSTAFWGSKWFPPSFFISRKAVWIQPTVLGAISRQNLSYLPMLFITTNGCQPVILWMFCLVLVV